MNYIVCKPVMIGANQTSLSRSFNPTWLLAESWFPRHLYLVSEENIKESDLYIYNGAIYKAIPPVLLAESLNKEVLNIKTRNKIKATTDKSLGLPLIPKSFIEEYVQKQGKIDEVRVKINKKYYPGIVDCGDPDLYDGDRFRYEVIISPVDDWFNKNY